MQPTMKETMVVGRGMPDPKPAAQQVMISQSQLQQMQRQMAAMHEQLEQQRQQIEMQRQQPTAKTYTLGQLQVLLACETIDQILQEFDISELKKIRMGMARNYLLALSDLTEFMPEKETGQQSAEQQGAGSEAELAGRSGSGR
jgi:hypothetical protein